MTLLVAFNDTVLVDSCVSIGGTLTSVNKVIQYKGLTYACSGSPDVAHMCVSHSLTDVPSTRPPTWWACLAMARASYSVRVARSGPCPSIARPHAGFVCRTNRKVRYSGQVVLAPKHFLRSSRRGWT